jgi:hypothetical protein
MMIPGFGVGLVIETRSLPALARCYPCSFTFYVADPSAPLYLACSRSLDRYLTALPAMSLAAVAPFPICGRIAAATSDH